MTDGSVLYAFQNLYEPVQNGNSWVVHYKQNNKWQSEACVTRESAYVYYYTKLAEFKAQFMTQERGGK